MLRISTVVFASVALFLSQATDAASEANQNNDIALDQRDHGQHFHHDHHHHRDLKSYKENHAGILCGMHDPNPTVMEQSDQAIQKWLKENGKPPEMEQVVTIDVYWHSIRASDGSGGITNEMIQDSIDALNMAYAITGFDFNLAGITTTDNDDYYTQAFVQNDIDFNMKASTRVGAQADLNIWSVGSTAVANNVGYSAFPWDYATDPVRDGVVFITGVAAGGTFPEYNEGDILVHEVGHWLGLFHPFDGGCESAGDYVDDTPPQGSPNYSCPMDNPPDTCDFGSPDSIHNYMDYTNDACSFEFTFGQAERMLINWNLYRASGLTEDHPTIAPVTLAPTAITRPLEDGCAVATTLGVGSNIFASTDGAPLYQTRTCGFANAQVAAGLWYKVAGTGATLTASLCDFSGYDTMLSVWLGPCSAGLTCVGGNDDFCSLRSRVTWNSVIGAEYYIFVHGFNGRTGEFDLTISGATAPPSPFTLSPTIITAPSVAPATIFPTSIVDYPRFEAGCSDATSLVIGGPPVFSSTFGSQRYLTRPCAGAFQVVSPGVWFKVTGIGGPLIASLCGTATYDTMLSVWAGPCSELICIGGIDDFCGLESAVNWFSFSDVEYYIFVHGFNGDSGDFGISISEGIFSSPPTSPPLPPISPPSPPTFPPISPPISQPPTGVGTLVSGCLSAFRTSIGTVVASSTVDVASYDIPACGSATSTTSPGLWYTFEGNGEVVTASLCGYTDDFDSMISVFRVQGSCRDVTCITGNDEYCGYTAQATFSTVSGGTYLIYVHGFLGSSGDFQLTLTSSAAGPTPPPAGNPSTPAPTIAPTCGFAFSAFGNIVNRAAGFFGGN